MHRPIPTLVAVLIPVLFAAELRADRPQRLELVSIRAAAAPPARVYGIVRDQSGHTVAGVSVVAMGATVAEASSDRVGRFVLTLPPGSYLLRATRDGYLSTVREPIRVSMGAPLERNLTLVRQAEPIATAVSASAVTDPSDHAHTTLAWRLRQMRRIVLRDEALAGV
ncbi:MAG TPA: carboxypeptidase-like regulatory domain-containing protein, partial [Vicinamibacterales bacterium]|nr:carboxypeptidase-like regulatory domain-containing protein [Vicinamibacterales bacterium]